MYSLSHFRPPGSDRKISINMSSEEVTQSLESNQSPLTLLPNPLELPLISVKQKGVFDYYGKVDTPFLDSAAKYLATLTNLTLETASHPLRSFLETTHADCAGQDAEKAACWLTIRLSTPNNEFATPRWHQDGQMYTYDESRQNAVQSKYGVTLSGPPTLILEHTTPQNVCTIRTGAENHFYWRGKDVSTTQEERDRASDQFRAWLAEQFQSETRLHIEDGRIVRFSWGREDSPIHSEPDLVSDRVFMTVLFGSETEMRAMAKFREEPFGEPTMC